LRVVVAVLVGLYLWFYVNPTLAGNLNVQPVTNSVYAIVGPLGNRDETNLGNNATFGLIVTDEGAVLIDAGGSANGARQLETAVRTVTDKPIVAVINTGGQDHRWLGNGYFKSKGAVLYASGEAVADQKERFQLQYQILETLIGKDNLAGTEAVHADQTFEDKLVLKIGGLDLHLIHGAAHTPGDAIVWVPSKRVAFAGDLVYTESLLGIIDVSALNDWIDSFAVLEGLNPAYIVLGHGGSTTLAKAQIDTRNYLLNLREKIRAIIAAGKGDREAVAINQDSWKHLQNFELLAKRNALAAFIQLEFE